MSFWEIAAYLIAIIIILIFSKIFIKPLKNILWLCLNSALGWVFLYGFNIAFETFGFSLGTNIVTASLCGVLGIPGFILLLVLKFIV